MAHGKYRTVHVLAAGAALRSRHGITETPSASVRPALIDELTDLLHVARDHGIDFMSCLAIAHGKALKECKLVAQDPRLPLNTVRIAEGAMGPQPIA